MFFKNRWGLCTCHLESIAVAHVLRAGHLLYTVLLLFLWASLIDGRKTGNTLTHNPLFATQQLYFPHSFSSVGNFFMFGIQGRRAPSPNHGLRVRFSSLKVPVWAQQWQILFVPWCSPQYLHADLRNPGQTIGTESAGVMGSTSGCLAQVSEIGSKTWGLQCRT